MLKSSGELTNSSANLYSRDNNPEYQSQSAADLLRHFGMSDVRSYNVNFHLENRDGDYRVTTSMSDVDSDDITEFVIGHRLVEFGGRRKEVVAVFIRGTNGTIQEWSSNFDVGANTNEYFAMTGGHPDWRNKSNHKGFDVAAVRALRLIRQYSGSVLNSSAEKAFWVTGHSRGAAIANIVSANLIDEGNEVFGYTFAAPNTTTAGDYNADRYGSIFNIINSDDMVPCLPLEDWGFEKYGKTIDVSIKGSYENKWEKFTDIRDYNYNGSMGAALDAFSEIADSREDLYVYTGEHSTFLEFYGDSMNNREEIYGERISKYCRIYDIESRPIIIGVPGYPIPTIEFYLKVEQTPAFLMMILADLVPSAENGGQRGGGEDEIFGLAPIGFKVAHKFNDAKIKFCFAAADSKDAAMALGVGGMEHAHLPETYYFIAKNVM